MSSNKHSPQSLPVTEITIRSIIFGLLTAVIFTAANLYLGLKIGFTFATSIPAAIMSMSLFKMLKNSNILENNIVQTLASVGGAIGGMGFTIPAFIIIGYWTQIQFMEVFTITSIGCILGVLYTVPLRSSLIVESNLRYPEGVACAYVLKLGCNEVDEEGREIERNDEKTEHGNVVDIAIGFITAFIVSLGQSAFKILSTSWSYVTTAKGAVLTVCSTFSPALLAAGYLVGPLSAVSFFIGYVLSIALIGWISISDPNIAAKVGSMSDLNGLVGQIWSTKLRYIGVGFMFIAAVWTIITLIPPLTRGIKASFSALSHYKQGNSHLIKRTDRNIPINYVVIGALILLVPVLIIFYNFIDQMNLGQDSILLLLGTVISTYIISFIICAAAGYMAGLVGTSYTPISGMIIITTVIIAFLVMGIASFYGIKLDQNIGKSLMALVILATSFVLAVGVIANDNMQDLKTGQLVKATPSKQQIALIIGAVFGALVLAYITQLLYQAYGFVGAPMPRAGMDPELALIAPQANLVANIITGIFTGKLEWFMINIGIVLGVISIIIAIILKRLYKFEIYPIAISVAIYLPPQYIFPIVLGGFLSFITQYIGKQRKLNKAMIEQRGALVVSGFIMGESIFGILMAILLTYWGASNAFVIGITPGLKEILGISAFILMLFIIYNRVLRK